MTSCFANPTVKSQPLISCSAQYIWPDHPSFTGKLLLLLLTARTPITLDFLPNLFSLFWFLLLVLSHLSRPEMPELPRSFRTLPISKLIQSHSYGTSTLGDPKICLYLCQTVPSISNDINHVIWHLSTGLLCNKSKTGKLWLPISQLSLWVIPISVNGKLHPFRTKSLKLIPDSSCHISPHLIQQTAISASAFKIHGTVTTCLNSTHLLVQVTIILHLHYCNSLLIGRLHFHLCPPKSWMSVAFLKDRSSHVMFF